MVLTFLQLVYGQADLSVEQVLEIGSLFGQSSRTLYFTELCFIEPKAKLKPTYLNIVNPFDIYSWIGLLVSFTLVCTCHVIIYWFEQEYMSVVSLLIRLCT